MGTKKFVVLGVRTPCPRSTAMATMLIAALAVAAAFTACNVGAETNRSITELQILTSGIQKAWTLTSEGYDLMGGRPSLGSEKPIVRDKLPEAKQKFAASEKVLDGAEPQAMFPRDLNPEIYAHADYVHASNLYGLGIVELLEKSGNSGFERYISRSLDLAEDSFKKSLNLMGEPAWADNARNCASLLVELHALSAIAARAHGDREAQAEHEWRLEKIATWLRANSR